MRYLLALDEPRKDDVVLNEGNRNIYIDPFTLQHLANQLKIDYVKNRGFKLITPEEILAYGLQLKAQ